MIPENYVAFISYRHICNEVAQDADYAKDLQDFLQGYELPRSLSKKFPRCATTIRPVFRDTELRKGDRLTESIRTALRASSFLIVVCTPNIFLKQKEDDIDWISREIEFFLQEHNGDIRRVIPLVYRRAGDRLQDCLPALLKDTLAFEVVDLERKDTYCDLVAKLLSIPREDLRRKFRYKPQRIAPFKEVSPNPPVPKTLRWKSCLAQGFRILLLLMVAAFATFIWDFSREKVSYYRDYVEYYNIPRGLGKLSEKEVKKLNMHYRFTERYYKLRKVECCNSAGVLSESKYVWAMERPAAIIMHYFDPWLPWANKVSSCDYLDKSGRVVVSPQYPDDYSVTFNRVGDDGLFKGIASASNVISAISGGDKDSSRKAAVYCFKVERDGQGRIVRELFQDVYRRNLVQNEEDAYGRRFKRDSDGRVVSMRYLAADGESVQASPKGVAGYDIEYNKEGLATRYVNVGIDEMPIANADGVAVEVYDWKEGNHVGTRYLDISGNPCWHRKSVSGMVVEYDPSGNATKLSFFAPNGKACLHEDGGACIVKEYDSRGNEIELSYYDRDGVPCVNREGVAKYKTKYDSDNNPVELRFFGVDGEPCQNVHGFYGVKMTFVQGRETMRSFYKSDMQTLCFNVEGVAGCKSSYTPEGNVRTISYFGVDEMPCVHKDGNAGYRIDYGEHERISCITFLGVDGNPCMLKDGYAGVRKEYDAQGRETLEMYLGVDGNPLMQPEGFAGIEKRYDTSGREIWRRYLGEDRTPCVHPDGNAGFSREYDERGRETCRMYFGLDDSPCMLKDGYAGVRKEYDEQGRETLVMYLGVDRKPLMQPAGYAGIQAKFDKNGNLLFWGYLGEDEELICPQGRAAALQRVYDDKGKLQEEYLMNERKEPMMSYPGGAGKQFVYDEAGRKIKEIFLNEQLKPCMTEMGYAISRYTYGEGNVQIENLDLENRTVDSSLGYAYQDIVLDAHGNYASITYRNAAGESVSLSDGTFRKVYVYDKDGKKRRHTEFYDKEGKLLRREFE